MDIQFLNFSWFGHYKLFELLTLEINEWKGSLIFFEWHEGDIMWDLMFIKGEKPDVVG